MLPRKIGVCLVPRNGYSFNEYRPERHGPLVECRFRTAAYVVGDGICALCGGIGCCHPELLGPVLTLEEWTKLPDRFERDGNVYDKKGIHHR